MKNSKSIRSGVEIGLLYSIITIGLGALIGLLLTISGIIKTNNILLLLLMALLLYHLTKKKLQSYKRYDALSYIVAASLIISVSTVLFQLICTYIEATSIDAVIDFTNLFEEYSIIIIRQFILYGIMLYVLFVFSNRSTLYRKWLSSNIYLCEVFNACDVLVFCCCSHRFVLFY